MMKEYRDIMVFVEQREGELQKVSLELLGKARSLADKTGQRVIAMLLGYRVEGLVEELYHYGADKVVLSDMRELGLYLTEYYAAVSSEIISMQKPEICMFGATAIGRDLAPRIAARIQTGLTADCTSLDIDGETGNLLMTRPAFGGNIMATIICPEHYPQMSTVRPGVMQMMEKDTDRSGDLVLFKKDMADISEKITILEVVKAVKKKKNIEDASVLISGGRGVGCKENLVHLEELAETMGGVVSGSRAIVDQGWIEHGNQVGQTGKTVRPDLYVACGISGAIQHLAGMEESEFIIAINKDENAPIFQTADLGIVGDANRILPELSRKVRAHIEEKQLS